LHGLTGLDAIAIASESLFLHLGGSSIALVFGVLFKIRPSVKLPSDHAVGMGWAEKRYNPDFKC
jgi:hypothetical protein